MYSVVPESRGWCPGGCRRLLVNTDRRPGISQDQFAAGRHVTAQDFVVRNSFDMENEGLGIIPLIAAAVSAAGSLIPAVIDAKKKKKEKVEPAPEQPGFMGKYGLLLALGGIGVVGAALMLRRK